MLTVKQQHLEKDGRPFFYLADTAWSALTNAELSDWEYYLTKRESQGFNVIQIDLLRQWDASPVAAKREPFAVTYTEQGYVYDYQQLNEDYFARAEKMIQMVVDHGMVPALVLLWANYVPGTWMKELIHNNPMPFDQLHPYVEAVTRRFQKYHPLYLVSGDVNFPDDDPKTLGEITRYYTKVLRVLRQTDPQTLATFHINGESTNLPQRLLEGTDFFAYQSGHGKPGQDTSFTIQQTMRSRGYTGPIINLEPCYELMPKFDATIKERFNRADVRKAAWQSLLAGANAGVTYGAHGIWSWHTVGAPFLYEHPYDWYEALQAPGADDFSFLKHLAERLNLAELVPQQDDLGAGVLVAKAGDKTIIYSALAKQVDLGALGLTKDSCHVTLVDLATHNFRHPIWSVDGRKIEPFGVTEDALLVCTPK